MENKMTIPKNVESHLEGLLSVMENTEVTLDDLKSAWIEKELLFEKQTKSLGMREVDEFIADNPGGAILLTFSGSLISLYSARDRRRRVEYASIKMRSDVPDVVTAEHAELEESITLNNPAAFTGGELKKTSSVYKILTFDGEVPFPEQDKRIREATIFLTNGFVRINRTLSVLSENSPDQFDMRSMVRYIAGKNNLSQKQVKELLEDYLSVLKSGLILSGRVSLGSIGNLYLKLQDARGARVMKLPGGDEEVTVKAKPQMYVPKISFSNRLKEEVSGIEIK